MCQVPAFLDESALSGFEYHFAALLTRKSPSQGLRRAASLVGVQTAAATATLPSDGMSVAQLTRDDVAEQLPFLALEPLHLKLFDRGKIGRGRIDGDTGQRGIGREILQI